MRRSVEDRRMYIIYSIALHTPKLSPFCGRLYHQEGLKNMFNSYQSCNSSGFDPSILWHSVIWGAAEEEVLNTVPKKI
jgi:hypothetical protein